MMRPALLLATLLLPLAASAQDRKPLDHDAYERWRYISDELLSHDGRWAAWREAPDTIGDSDVVVRRIGSDTLYVIERGDDPRFAPGGRWLVALVKSPYDSTRAAKIDGKKDDDLPKDSLAILDLGTGRISKLGPVKSFALPDDAGDALAVLFDRVKADSTAADSTEAAPDSAKALAAKADSTVHDKKDGTRLLLRRLSSGAEWSFDSAVEYGLAKNGAWLVYAAESKDGEADGAFAVNAETGEAIAMKTGEGHYRQLAIDDAGTQAAFVADADSFASEQPGFILFRAALGEAAEAVAFEGGEGLPDGWWVSEHRKPGFSDSGRRLYFGTAPRPAKEEEDKRPDEEKVKLDVWSWTDPLLQPMQLVQREAELKRSYAAVVYPNGHVVQLSTEDVPEVDLLETGDAEVVIGESSLSYRKEISWDSPGYSDYYVIDAGTGERRRVLEGIRSNADASPDGAHLAWWDGSDRAWKITDTESGETVNVTAGADVRFDNEEHDWPYLPGEHGSAGWTKDGGAFLVYDDFDVWIATADGSLLSSMTDGAGRRDRVRYRYVELDPEAKGIDLERPLFLSAFDETTKASGFARLERGADGPTRLVMGDVRYGRPLKAKAADRLLFTRESFVDFPDLWTSGLDLSGLTRLSSANPQQAEYRWGTTRLVHWTSIDGERLDGILVRPDGFDPTRRHPMMVYFYERNSDGLHRHTPPRPGGSSIGIAFYASRGYVVFIPDIPYKVGYPGESAMNAVMPGVTHLIDQGFVDPERIGVQGHSWGGYQITYMVTQTNLFAAAEAGAPVTNMTSAYGGIRWGSGMSRMFQYEKTQSRIGGTLWDAHDRYIHNSPLFQAPKVQTPIMYMHNDQDGAVPWYQGIEFFVALRRLGKPVWMLNYNGADHGLQNYWQRVDLQVRMQQFFDHYLLGAPAPVWMTEGIPAVKKGRTMGLELTGEQ
jgi:dipeptidyl aminopeptidase/acylaminoacyl peptidase